ncbi:MAG: hypothetical protein KDD44_13205, partial [Bdellovibrionales bacterium]|nr:hypothetical protein [Bdellovibrionales bacterium]
FKKTNSIAVQFIGDGAFGEGVVYEALNLAALWRAPLLIVVENNYYAQSTPSTLQLAGSFAGRAAAFGISATEVTTNDVRIVRALATEQIAAVRSECRPAMLIVNTYRLKPHSKGDEMRDPTEIERWRSRDPLSIDYGLPNASELLQAALGRIAEESEDALKALRGGACAA